MQDIHTFTLHCHAVIFFMLATAAELTLLGSWKHLKLSYLLYWGSTQLLTERRKGEHLLQPLCSEQGQAPNVLQDGESLVPLGSQRHQILPSLASWWNFPCSPTGERQLVLAVGRGVLNYDEGQASLQGGDLDILECAYGPTCCSATPLQQNQIRCEWKHRSQSASREKSR